MKIKFDSNQDFQLDAIRSIVDVFTGQPMVRSSLEWQSDAFSGELLTEMGVGNSLSLLDETILSNVQKIQQENGLEQVKELQGLNFSVEMNANANRWPPQGMFSTYFLLAFSWIKPGTPADF